MGTGQLLWTRPAQSRGGLVPSRPVPCELKVTLSTIYKFASRKLIKKEIVKLFNVVESN